MSTQFLYKNSYELINEIQNFTKKLPSIDEVWKKGNCTYSCCSERIPWFATISNKMSCPHCLEKVELKGKKERSFSGDGYFNEVVLYPIIIDKKYKMKENGEFVLKEYNSDIEINDINEYIKEHPGMKVEKIEYVFKTYIINSSAREEIGLISNIMGALLEGLPDQYYYPDERGNSKAFGYSEMEYLRAMDLYGEFCDLLAFKQIILNEMIVRTLEMITDKMRSAGMNLL